METIATLKTLLKSRERKYYKLKRKYIKTTTLHLVHAAKIKKTRENKMAWFCSQLLMNLNEMKASFSQLVKSSMFKDQFSRKVFILKNNYLEKLNKFKKQQYMLDLQRQKFRLLTEKTFLMRRSVLNRNMYQKKLTSASKIDEAKQENRILSQKLQDALQRTYVAEEQVASLKLKLKAANVKLFASMKLAYRPDQEEQAKS